MRALSIRQTYAELILRVVKTIEYRGRATTIIGERFYIYASRLGDEDAATLDRAGGVGRLKTDTPPACDDAEYRRINNAS